MRLDHLLSMENGRQLALGLEQIRPDILNGKNPKGYDEIRKLKEISCCSILKDCLQKVNTTQAERHMGV